MQMQAKKKNAPEVRATEASSVNNPYQKGINMSNSTEIQVSSTAPLATPDLVTVDGKVTTTSQQVARHFGKRHDTVLRAIRNLECSADYRLRNFAASSYVNEQGKEQPCFRLTRDGFVFLAMGFTGKEAAQWKEAYIEAFNRMEAELLAQHAPAIPYAAKSGDKLNAGEQEILRDMLTSAVKRLPHARQAGAMVKGWGKLKAHFKVSYRDIPADEFTEAVSILARHITEWEVLDAPKKYHFPLELADPHDRWLQNAWMTPRALMDPKNRALELELLEQLERDGHDVAGVKVRILAMRQAMAQVEQTKDDMRRVRERLGPIMEIIDVGLAERGLNVKFAGAVPKNQPSTAIGA